MIRCNSGADGTVRMKEGSTILAYMGVVSLLHAPKTSWFSGFVLTWTTFPAPIALPRYPVGQFCCPCRADMDLTHSQKVARETSRRIRRRNYYLVPISLGVALVGWHMVASLGGYMAYLLPGPAQVWSRFLSALLDGRLLYHTAITLGEVLAGLALGVMAASTLGYILAKSQSIERFLSPYIVASQSIPIVAIAPLLVIWFGPGLSSKVLICALIVFFPVLINTIVGLRSVPDELRDLMRSLRATTWQTFKHLEVPAALPVFLGGLRIGATLAVIGAVVGELVGADRGLGFLISVGRGQYDTALVFVAVFALVGMAMALYGVVVLIEARLLSWQQRPGDPG
jgi:NitT/TauT family transport system permease protein